jgi:hypothetical protein
MAQFEEQFTAAKVVTSFTRPLNLYYGLAQAGMAIAAARAPDPWSFNKHGLELVDRHADLADMQVRPESEGAFQKVASGTGSPGISASISLGTLWASLPDLAGRATLPTWSDQCLSTCYRMKTPPGYNGQLSTYRVRCLQKNRRGLHDLPRSWLTTLAREVG